MEKMLVLKKLQVFLECRQIQLEDGATMVLLKAKEHQAINVVFLFLQMAHLKAQTKPNPILYMLEFHLKSSKTIWRDNSIFLKVNIQIISLLKTLEAGLITREKDFLNCWNEVIKEKSEKLWSSVKTDSVDLDSNCLNGVSYKMVQNSWFKIKLIKLQKKNLLRTFLPFYKFLLADGMVKENTELIKVKKYRLKLSRVQIKLFNKWVSHYRYSYNQALSLVKGEISNNEFDWISSLGKIEGKASYNTSYSKFDLRNLIVPSHNCCSRSWITETPTALRSRAVFEMHNRYKTCLSNLKAGNIKFFDMKFKSKKQFRWTMDLPKENIITTSSNLCKVHQEKDYLGNIITENVSQENCSTCKFLPLNEFKLFSESGKIKSTENFKEDIVKFDSKLHFDGINYYILIPYSVEVKRNKEENWFCSLDPGVRKFQTIYSPDNGTVSVIGDRSATKIYDKLLCLDNLIKKQSKVKTKKLSIEKIKLLNKIKNLQQELHRKTSKFLCENYNNILLPKLTKDNDIISKKRNLHSKTVRSMVVLGHSKFVELLKTKANEYSNVNVTIVTEEFTSQTCLNCKTRTKTSKEYFTCKNCNLNCDRDVLGSINILLKNWGLMNN